MRTSAISSTDRCKRSAFLQGPGELAVGRRDFSEETAREVDCAVRTLVQGAFERAVEILRTHREAVSSTAQHLLEVETLSGGELPEIATANALRAIIDSGADNPVVSEAQAILGPADNYGGRVSFRYIAPFTALLIVIFGALYMHDRKTGGYRVVKLGEA